MMKRGRGEVVLGLPKIKRLYPDLCFDHPWKMEKTTKELETALLTLPQFIYMGTQVGRFYCPRTWFRTKWRSSISQCLQWTLHWVSWTYTKVQVYNSHCQHVHVFLSFCSYECESLSHNCARTVRSAATCELHAEDNVCLNGEPTGKEKTLSTVTVDTNSLDSNSSWCWTC